MLFVLFFHFYEILWEILFEINIFSLLLSLKTITVLLALEDNLRGYFMSLKISFEVYTFSKNAFIIVSGKPAYISD